MALYLSDLFNDSIQLDYGLVGLMLHHYQSFVSVTEFGRASKLVKSVKCINKYLK